MNQYWKDTPNITRVELAIKTSRGMTENALKGKLNGGNPTFGYRMTKERTYEPDEQTAPVVVEVFTRYADGEKINHIAKDLALRGIQTPHGNPITFNVVHNMLKNRRYIGEYRFQEVLNKNSIPALVSQELFDRVQERLEKNKKAPARTKAEVEYILTTKLKCGRCGNLMIGESGTSKTGSTYHYYKCSHAKRKLGCTKKAISKDWIEDLVVQHTIKMIMDDPLIEALSERILKLWNSENKKLPQLRVRLSEVEQGIQNMLNAIQMGILTSSTKQRLEELEQTKQELEIAIASEQLARPDITKESIVYYIKKFRNMDLKDVAARKNLIDNFVNSIYLYDDKLVFTFNFKDGTKEIFLSELEETLASKSSDINAVASPKRTSTAKAVLVLFVAPHSESELCKLLRNLRKNARYSELWETVKLRRAFEFRLSDGSPATTNPNSLETREWFGFVLFLDEIKSS